MKKLGVARISLVGQLCWSLSYVKHCKVSKKANTLCTQGGGAIYDTPRTGPVGALSVPVMKQRMSRSGTDSSNEGGTDSANKRNKRHC